MQEPRRLRIIAKQHEFDGEKWKQLLTAFAYVLYEQRKAEETAGRSNEQQNETSNTEAA